MCCAPAGRAGTFHVAEIDLAALLPADALAPFAEELRARERRRERRSQVRAVATAACHSLNSALRVGWSVAPATHK